MKDTIKTREERRRKAIDAVANLRKHAKETGRDKLTLAEINREIQEVRRAAKKAGL